MEFIFIKGFSLAAYILVILFLLCCVFFVLLAGEYQFKFNIANSYLFLSLKLFFLLGDFRVFFLSLNNITGSLAVCSNKEMKNALYGDALPNLNNLGLRKHNPGFCKNLNS